MTHHLVRRIHPCLLFGFVLLAIASSQAPAINCPVACNDWSACTADSCDTTTGTCRFDPRNCDDHNSCTTDSCFPFTFNPNGCRNVFVANGTACDDGNSCTTGDACSSGHCTGQVRPEGTACDDRNSCTTSDACDANGACVGTALAAGTACDDQNLCTTGDTCQDSPSGGTSCQGTPKDCGDANLCTEDKCDPATGQCSNPPVNCNDGNSCTADACDPATGACIRTNVSASCSDGSLCTHNDFCSGGNCLATVDCDDHIACTRDSCGVPFEGCDHVRDDALCNDNNVCTRDSCETFGCRNSPLAGNFCPSTNHCFVGVCSMSGICRDEIPLTCNDANICTIDSCDPAIGCIHTPTSSGSACDDYNPCTLNETCNDSGGCVGEPQPGAPCDDQNVCTTGDLCIPNGVGTLFCFGRFACNDDNRCTDDLCIQPNGDCLHFPTNCNDNNPCTADSCDPASGCLHQPSPQTITCGVGACQRTVACPGPCVPGNPTTEVCNGIDDDCDGQVDENLGTTISCGVGACRREAAACVGGTPQTCTPGTPTPEVCNGIDDDCDGEVDENKVQAECVINPGTLNLNAQGSSFSFECKLTDICDPNNPTPIEGVSVSYVYISRADSAETSTDDVVLPDPFTAPCPSPTQGFLYEPGIGENLDARDNTNKGATFRFNVPSDGLCTTHDGDRQDLGARLSALPDNTNATLCITGKIGEVLAFHGCTTALVRNKGNR